MVKWRIGTVKCLIAVALVLLVGCQSEKSGNLPAAPDPEKTPEQPIPTPAAKPDDRLPSWVKTAVPFQLLSPRDYSALEDIFGVVYPDASGSIVGDPLIRLEIQGERDQQVNGKLYFGFEDAKGFVYLTTNAVREASLRNSSALDMIFSDDEGAFRVVGMIQNSRLSANMYYRIRAANENQCRRYIVCDYSTGRYACREWVDVNACRHYLETTDSRVHRLGSFTADYLKWVQ